MQMSLPPIATHWRATAGRSLVGAGRQWLNGALLAVGSLGGVALSRRAAAQVIPYRPGITFTFATKPIDADVRPDFERVLTIVSLTPEETHVDDSWSYAPKATGKVLSNTYHRTFSRRETAFARSIWLGELGGDTAQHRGTSYMMASSTVMRLLRTSGEVHVTLRYYNDVENPGTLQRSEPGTVPVSILVNGRRQAIPAIHAHLDAESFLSSNRLSYDLWFADDTAHAWLLRVHAVQNGVPGSQDLVRIDWTDNATKATLAAAMSTSCRAQVYGIHFATASAEVTPASTPTLDEIADLLRHQPSWRVTIEGHTDSIGGGPYNQDLSQRRAAAVRDTLVDRYKIDPARLATAGYGLTRPLEANTTLAGRARNRRVELVRACTATSSTH